jgi:hypothetical protein
MKTANAKSNKNILNKDDSSHLATSDDGEREKPATHSSRFNQQSNTSQVPLLSPRAFTYQLFTVVIDTQE